MTRREYTERVLAALRRVTRAERAAIRAEIDAHMEDHVCALLDLGYPPELAEERAMAAMGDPEEVGRELDKQYPFRWLAVKWAAMALTAVLVLMMLGQMDWQMVRINLASRFWPSQLFTYKEPYEFLKGDGTDVRMEVGPAVARVCAAKVVKIQPGAEWAGERPVGSYVAVLRIRCYGKSLRDLGRSVSVPYLEVEGDGGHAGSGAYGLFSFVSVEPGETELTLACSKYGYDAACKVPLDWEGAT